MKYVQVQFASLLTFLGVVLMVILLLGCLVLPSFDTIGGGLEMLK